MLKWLKMKLSRVVKRKERTAVNEDHYSHSTEYRPKDPIDLMLMYGWWR